MLQLPPIPSHLQKIYSTLRIIFYLSLCIFIYIFTVQLFFPTFSFTYNFRVSNSHNTLSSPHSDQNTPAGNGKIMQHGSLITSASLSGLFSSFAIDLALEKKSNLVETIYAEIHRTYQSFLLPLGDPIDAFPKENLYKIDDTYYVLQNETLYPFISTSAFLSRYEESFAREETNNFLSTHTLSEEFIGYRIGSLVSFADGVFIITSEHDIRPFGNAETFLALGYHFENVIPASEEEIGIYKRGRIILPGAIHPNGTLLFDKDTDIYYLIDQGFKRPVTNNDYLEFLKEKQIPIFVSSLESSKKASCTLEPGIFGRSFSCTGSINTLSAEFGNDFILSIQTNELPIELQILDVSFHTEKNKNTVLFTLSQIKQRLLSRFGIQQ